MPEQKPIKFKTGNNTEEEVKKKTEPDNSKQKPITFKNTQDVKPSQPSEDFSTGLTKSLVKDYAGAATPQLQNKPEYNPLAYNTASAESTRPSQEVKGDPTKNALADILTAPVKSTLGGLIGAGKTIGRGVNELGGAEGIAKIFSDLSSGQGIDLNNPNNLTGLSSLGLGTAEGVFAGATPFIPALSGFSMGTEAASKVIPDEAMKYIEQPVTSLTNPETQLGKNIAGVGDLASQLLMAHYGAKGYRGIKAKISDMKITPEVTPGTEPKTETSQSVGDVMKIENPEVLDQFIPKAKEEVPVAPQETAKPVGTIPKDIPPEGFEEVKPTIKQELPQTENVPNIEEKASLKNTYADAERAAADLPPVEKSIRQSAPDLFDEVKKEYDPVQIRTLAKQFETNPERPFTRKEQMSLVYDMSQLAKERETVTTDYNKAVESGDMQKAKDLQTQLLRNKDDIASNTKATTETGRSSSYNFSDRKLLIDLQKGTLEHELAVARANNGNRPLDPAREKSFTDIISKLDKEKSDLQTALNAERDKSARLEAEDVVKKMRKDASIEIRRQGRARSKEALQSEWQDLSKTLYIQLSSTMNARIPVEAIPTVLKMARNAVERGIISTEGIIDELYTELKGKVSKADIAEAITGYDQATPKKVREKSKTVKAKEESIRALENELAREHKKVEFDNKSKFDKVLYRVAKFARGMKLTSFATIGKLTSFSLQRLAVKPIEEGIGTGYKALFSKIPGLKSIAERSPTEAGTAGFKGEVNALAEFAKAINTKDFKDIMKNGETDFSARYGPDLVHLELDPEILDYFARFHTVLKEPLKKSTYSRSYTKYREFQQRNKIDMNDPVEMRKAELYSYDEAMRTILLRDNRVTHTYNSILNQLAQSGKVGNVAATGARVLMPIVRVPTNLAFEATEFAFGLPKAGASIIKQAITKGTDNLTPAEADYIYRNLKKGTIGAGLLYIGYKNPENVGGYYHRGEKRKEGEVKAGGLQLWGIDIPTWLIHNPIFEPLQMGATARRVMDKWQEKGASKIQSAAEAGLQTGMGLAKEIPFVDEPARALQALESTKNVGNFIGDLIAGSITAPDLTRIAKFYDKDAEGNVIKRQHGIWESTAQNVPLLRQQVPEVEKKKVKRSKTRVK